MGDGVGVGLAPRVGLAGAVPEGPGVAEAGPPPWVGVGDALGWTVSVPATTGVLDAVPRRVAVGLGEALAAPPGVGVRLGHGVGVNVTGVGGVTVRLGVRRTQNGR